MTDVIMPQMGESIAEGTIVKWFKNVGDTVKRDEHLFEISTDKVDAEIPSPEDGVLLEIVHGPGQTVEVGKVVARLGAPGEVLARGGNHVPSPEPEPAPPAVSAVPASVGGRSEGIRTPEELRRTRSSPLVRKMVREHGLELADVGPGTGISGRVTKADVLGYLERLKTQPRPAPVAPAAPPSQTPPREIPARFFHVPQPGQMVEPFTPMRQKIAEHMVMSQRISAHVCTFHEVDMTRVARLRSRHKAAYQEKGVKLTYTPFVMKAVVDALEEFRILNSSVVENGICYHSHVNLGMAVALDWGLIVPVIHKAEEKSLLGLTRALSDLADRARDKKLSPEEVQGGTFTITNPGIFGSLVGTPIINQPQVAILGVGAVTKRPVVTEDDAIAIRHMVMMALSFDHRIIDGATADRFMSRVRASLQEFPESSV
ncbi:MAG: dihydrolipoamide acetyltransferase family protein [Candidatus Eremiobacterota bacterium]